MRLDLNSGLDRILRMSEQILHDLQNWIDLQWSNNKNYIYYSCHLKSFFEKESLLEQINSHVRNLQKFSKYVSDTYPMYKTIYSIPLTSESKLFLGEYPDSINEFLNQIDILEPPSIYLIPINQEFVLSSTEEYKKLLRLAFSFSSDGIKCFYREFRDQGNDWEYSRLVYFLIEQ